MADKNMPHLGKLLSETLYEKRLSRADLAHKIGKHQNTVAGYIEEPSLQARILWDVSNALQVDFFDYLSKALNLNDSKQVNWQEVTNLKSQEIEQLQLKIKDLEKEVAIYREIALNRK